MSNSELSKHYAFRKHFLGLGMGPNTGVLASYDEALRFRFQQSKPATKPYWMDEWLLRSVTSTWVSTSRCV